jgi:hypothetical protein
LGKNAVMIPINGRNAQILNTYSILVSSATAPKTADPIPPIPNINPKNNPATNPILLGKRSVAKTKMAENAEAMINPIKTANVIVQNNDR